MRPVFLLHKEVYRSVIVVFAYREKPLVEPKHFEYIPSRVLGINTELTTKGVAESCLRGVNPENLKVGDSDLSC